MKGRKETYMTENQRKLLRSYFLRSNFKNEGEIAEKVLGICQAALSKKMNGKSNFSTQEAKLLADAFKIPNADVIEIFFK